MKIGTLTKKTKPTDVEMKNFKFFDHNKHFPINTIPETNVFRHNIDHMIPTQYEPMRRNRILVNFPDHMNIPTHFIREIERPRVVVESIDHLSPEPHRWNPIRISFTEVIEQNITNILIQNYTQIIRFDMSIEMIDPTGVNVESWTLFDCIITEIFHDSLSYNFNDESNVHIMVQPNYVTIL